MFLYQDSEEIKKVSDRIKEKREISTFLSVIQCIWHQLLLT